MKINMKICQDSHIGLVREENQDNFAWFSLDDKELFIVADGMGGVEGGRTASGMAIQKVHERFARGGASIPEVVKEAIDEANRSIYEKGQSGDPNCCNMGTTIVVLVVYENKAYTAHVGDSRIYIFRNGKLKRLTKDHSRVQYMIDKGLLDPKDAWLHPESHIITRCVGTRPLIQSELKAEPIEIIPGDIFLLCTDGLCGLINDTEIETIIKEHGPSEDICKNMIEAALARGGDDNVTVQVVSFQKNKVFPHPSKKSLYLRSIFVTFSLLFVITLIVAFFFRHNMDEHPIVSLLWSCKEKLNEKALFSSQDTETTINVDTQGKIKNDSSEVMDKKQDDKIGVTIKSEKRKNEHGKGP